MRLSLPPTCACHRMWHGRGSALAAWVLQLPAPRRPLVVVTRQAARGVQHAPCAMRFRLLRVCVAVPSPHRQLHRAVGLVPAVRCVHARAAPARVRQLVLRGTSSLLLTPPHGGAAYMPGMRGWPAGGVMESTVRATAVHTLSVVIMFLPYARCRFIGRNYRDLS